LLRNPERPAAFDREVFPSERGIQLKPGGKLVRDAVRIRTVLQYLQHVAVPDVNRNPERGLSSGGKKICLPHSAGCQRQVHDPQAICVSLKRQIEGIRVLDPDVEIEGDSVGPGSCYFQIVKNDFRLSYEMSAAGKQCDKKRN